jgi:two-component system sensor histidine kinase and response regulator WspE
MNDLGNLADFSLLELFQEEVQGQIPILTNGLISLETAPGSPVVLEALMRSAHSLKGAARIVNQDEAVRVTHVMEDCFSAGQRGELFFTPELIDLMLRGVDLLVRLSCGEGGTGSGGDEIPAEVERYVVACETARLAPPPVPATPELAETDTVTGPAPPSAPLHAAEPAHAPATPSPAILPVEPGDRVIRISADTLNRLLGLAGESLVATRWLPEFAHGLRRLKHRHHLLRKQVDLLQDELDGTSRPERLSDLISQLRSGLSSFTGDLVFRLGELELYDRQTGNRAHQLYGEALSCRMRPFADGVLAFPRTVRDLARGLGKEARLEIIGGGTAVDRDILDALEAPLTHLLRNAVDHGLESPEERRLVGKPPCGVIRLMAEHRSGMLFITVADDGRGIDVESVRRRVVERNLSPAETAARLTDAEVLEFLFLPGFTLRDRVTELSGRGVGLDVVQTMLREVRGTIRIATESGKGACFELRLPLSLSVVRALVVEIGGEGYAFPLSRISRVLTVPAEVVESTEGRQHFPWEGERVGLVSGAQILGREDDVTGRALLPVLILEREGREYGVVVDRFAGEQELTVQPLDPALGRVPNIAAGSVRRDGSPLLVIDVDDFFHSIEGVATGGQMRQVRTGAGIELRAARKVLVVDDSLTVRELQRKLLEAQGYLADIAVDGMDGWNAVRLGGYDLLITDIDMPRMDGIELTTLVKRDVRLRNLPVMVVSYKDRDEDRQRGLMAGADYYLTKASFHDETYITAVRDLIGGAEA